MEKFEDIFTEKVEQLTGKELMKKLETFDQSKPVYFARKEEGEHYQHRYPVNQFCSWRGSYSEPTIYSKGEEVFSCKDIISLWKDEFFGQELCGYKGGYFTMSEDSYLWADEHGCFNEYGVVDAVETKEAIFIVTDQCGY